MANEEFQKRILEELSLIKNEFREGFNQLKTRQDEIYDVVRAIEHSNQVGRSELDNQNIRISKLEGKFKRVAKAYNEEVDVDKASNL